LQERRRWRHALLEGTPLRLQIEVVVKTPECVPLRRLLLRLLLRAHRRRWTGGDGLVVRITVLRLTSDDCDERRQTGKVGGPTSHLFSPALAA
tara:strand:- start:133 stop:411 length:279 start_codon:yes stop_codon:yes gene_type:complete